MTSPHDGGTHLEWVEGRGWRFSPKFFRMRVLFIKTHFYSTHFTFHGGALTPYIYISYFQDDVMKWKYVPRYWPFIRGIHRSLVNSPNRGKGQWRGALMFSSICAWPNGWVNNQDSDDFPRTKSVSTGKLCCIWATVLPHLNFPAAYMLNIQVSWAGLTGGPLVQKVESRLLVKILLLFQIFKIWTIQSSVTINTFLWLIYIRPRQGLFKFVT